VQHVPLADKHKVSLKAFNRLVKMMEDECVELKESICAAVREMRKKKAKAEASAASTSKTPTSTPSHSRSASPTKSAMRDTSVKNLTTTPSFTNSSAVKRRVNFSFSDTVSASEDDEGIFAPETPSKKRPRRASSSSSASSSATTMRVMPVSKAQLASASVSSGEGEGEDVEMADATVLTPSRPKRRLVAASASPVAGPSTPLRSLATPTHAYRTPPSARIQLVSRLTDDEDDAEEVAGWLGDSGFDPKDVDFELGNDEDPSTDTAGRGESRWDSFGDKATFSGGVDSDEDDGFGDNPL